MGRILLGGVLVNRLADRVEQGQLRTEVMFGCMYWGGWRGGKEEEASVSSATWVNLV